MADSKQQFAQLYDSYGNASVAPDPEAMGGIGLASTNSADNPLAPQALTSGVYQGILVIGSGQVQSQNFVTGESGWQIRADGTAEFSDIFIRGTLKTVSVGDSIQDAIDFLNQYGGGEVRLDVGTFTLSSDITLYSGIALVGSGRDSTILDFGGGAVGVKVIGTSGARKKNVRIKDLTIQNSNATATIDTQYTDFWQYENVRITSCDQKGFRIQGSVSFSINNCRADNNTGNGFDFDATTNGDNERFLVINCVADLNSGIGFFLNSTPTNAVQNYNFIGCLSQTNGGDGYDITTSSSASLRGNFSSCVADQNTGIGFDISSNSAEINFVDCQSFDNSNDGFECGGNRVSFLGCVAKDNTGKGFEITGTIFRIIGCYSEDVFDFAAVNGTGIFIGNETGGGGSNDPKDMLLMPLNGSAVEIFSNGGASTRTQKRVLNMIAASGVSITSGDVVVLASNAEGDVINKTTTVGDNKVFGVAVAGITDTTYGRVLVEGFTDDLQVNGTTDIAIGDYLSCYSVAGIAAKAAAGDTVFAIALEAYTGNDSNGVIDAYILPWRFTLKADAASTTTAGTVELATAAETTTGTDATRAVTPDGLAGSDYGKRVIGIQVVDAATDTATGDGKAFFRIPSVMNGWNLVGVAMNVYTAGTTNTTDVQIRNITQTADMLSTKLTIDSGETDSSTAATPAVIDTNNDDVATGDKIAIDVDAVHTTAAKGLFVELIFQLP